MDGPVGLTVLGIPETCPAEGMVGIQHLLAGCG